MAFERYWEGLAALVQTDYKDFVVSDGNIKGNGSGTVVTRIGWIGSYMARAKKRRNIGRRLESLAAITPKARTDILSLGVRYLLYDR